MYGRGKAFYLSRIKPAYRMDGEEKPLLDRTALHAASISIDHPATGERMTFSAALPKDMSSVLKYLRKFRALKPSSSQHQMRRALSWVTEAIQKSLSWSEAFCASPKCL